MSRRIEQDGKFFRMRRGKLVQIPPEWVGRIRVLSGRRRRTWLRQEHEKQSRKTERMLKRELLKELLSL
jgi:hypothetical protein